MVIITRFALITWLLLPLAVADVNFMNPAAGDMILTTSLAAAWSESGQKPSLSTFSSYSLFLCAGGNDQSNYVNLFNLQPYATYGEGYQWSGAISTGWGGNNTNAYFLAMISTSSCGGTIINYSDRFTLAAMTGSFPPNVLQGIESIGTNTNGPSTDQSDAGPALACTKSVAAEPAITSPGSSAGTALGTSTMALLSSTTMSASISSSLSNSSSTSPSSSKSITLSTGKLAGIIVTAMIIFATICGIAAWALLRFRKRHTQHQSPNSSFASWLKPHKEMERLNSTDHLAELSDAELRKEMDGNSRHPTELSTVVRAELPARRSIYELPGS